MSHKFSSRVISALLLLGWILGLAQPAPVSAVILPQKQGLSDSLFEPLVIPADKFDTSPELSSIAPKSVTPGENKEIPNFVLPRSVDTTGGETEQSIVQSSPGGSIDMPAPVMSFEGINNINGVYPPDTQGDIGPNHYVQWVNLSFQIWAIDKVNHTATSVYGPAAGNTLWSGFGGACETTNSGDPITLYDPFANRWFMSQFAIPGSAPYYQCVAISQTSDPTGAWYRYQFTWPNNKLNDYPKFGVWPDAYYMTTNQFNSTGTAYQGVGVAALDRNKMLIGQPASMIYFDLFAVNSNFFGMLPADFDGPTSLPPSPGAPGLFAEWDDTTDLGDPSDTLRIWEFHVDWDTPANSTFGLAGLPNLLIPTANVDPNMCNYARSCIPQPGTSQKLDAISSRLMYRLQYRNYGDYQTLVSNHTVDVGGDHAGIYWFELHKTGVGAWSLYQQGVYAPDANHRWMGSLALDHVGNLALGYSVSSSSVYPSIQYAGRLADDPLGTLPQAEVQLFAGTGSQTGTAARWGDYSMMAVDPTDDCTFWYTQEYLAVTGTVPWRTRIGSFKFPNCSSMQPGQLSVSPPSLDATLLLGNTTVQSLLVTNIGGGTATFEMAEIAGGFTPVQHDYAMSHPALQTDVPWLSESPITATIPGTGLPLFLPGGMPFVPEAISGQASHPGLTTHSTTNGLIVSPSEPADATAILWNQPLSTVNQAAYVSQAFPDYPASSSFLADDFTNNQRWGLSTIFVPGDMWNGATTLMNATALHWQIYADNSGHPAGNPSGGGSPPLWSLSLSPTDPQVVLSTGTPGGYLSNVTLNLTAPLDLPAGHYWLVFFPTMSFATVGQYGRQPADTANGYIGQAINPGGGFGAGTSWQSWMDWPGSTLPDIAFRLEGQVINNYQYVDVTFDAGAVTQPGVYHAELAINNNTPYPVPNVPVTMTVTAPATWGKLEGIVSSLGYCDANPHPLAGVQVRIEPSVGQVITVTTDVNGYYSYWLDQSASPLVVSTSAPDHNPSTATGIVISGKQTTTLNFNLHSLQPCYQVSLTPATDAKFGARGDTVSYSLKITNTGSGTNTFTFIPSTNIWSLVVPDPVMLSAGSSTTVAVYVIIPISAPLGAFDTVTITANGAGGATASSVLTTTVNLVKIYLPTITKK